MGHEAEQRWRHLGLHCRRETPGIVEVNWLPIKRQDEDMDLILRIYVPDLEKFKTWKAPKAEKVAKK